MLLCTVVVGGQALAWNLRRLLRRQQPSEPRTMLLSPLVSLATSLHLLLLLWPQVPQLQEWGRPRRVEVVSLGLCQLALWQGSLRPWQLRSGWSHLLRTALSCRAMEIVMCLVPQL